jgi:DNA polymerase-1|tara:strand:- start:1476 stop:4025 length:2550 start_codon:yes stop_codon:yes gene_type:complete
MTNPQTSLFPSPAERSSTNGNTLIVIDGHALAFRSYYAIRELTNSKGQATNAVFGFVRSLLRILTEGGDETTTVVTFDAPAKTFRHEAYKDYKAGRAPTPDDLPGQIEMIKEIVGHLGLHQVEMPGLEADDLIGTIAKTCEQLGFLIEIVTSDRDAYQLISDRVCVRGLDKTERFGPTEVFEKYGVTVNQWTDYRALTGDSSDNIPGARGIGPKSAQKLLERYQNLDFILNNLDSVEPQSQAAKIRDSIDDVLQSRVLSKIVTNAPIEIDPHGWAEQKINREPLLKILKRLEFGSIIRELGLAELITVSYEEITWPLTDGAVGFVLSEASPMWANLDEMALARERKVSIAPNPTAATEYLEAAEQLDACDAKALSVLTRRIVGTPTQPGDDPLLMAYLCDVNTVQVEKVALRYGAGEWKNDAKSRAEITADLLRILRQQLDGKQLELYETIERPLQGILAAMEYRGIEVNESILNDLSASISITLKEIESYVRDLAENPDLNLNSRDQLADLLFDKLGLKAGRRTSTGKRSTAVSALEPLISSHEVVPKILTYRELSKLKNTYLDRLPKLIHPETGRIHTTFNQALVATGRLSSANPNLQNIPVRTEVGRKIRKSFVAASGWKLLVADYSQIELRILAHIADDPALINSFQNGEDIHRRTAAQIYNVESSEVSPSMRRVAKIINFGILYGMSAHRLSRELGINYDRAQSFIDTYFTGYPGVQKYIESTLSFCRDKGYVETLLGRRRHIPDIKSTNRNTREYAERTAYNMPIQGTAADIIKTAMIELAPALIPLNAHLLLQVHDELIIEAPETNINEVSKQVKATMEHAFQLKVPLVVDVGVSDNWLDAK